MFAADEPFISDFFLDTLNRNNYPVLKTPLIKTAKNSVDVHEFIEIYKKTGKIYTNSENSLSRIANILKDTMLPSKIELFKDKLKTRELLKSIYPDFFYKKVNSSELDNLNPDDLKFPFVIKPVIGFLSIGVYTVWNKDELKPVIQKIKSSMNMNKNLFPKSVLNADNFIIEEYIEGEEYAVDVYYDDNYNPVILNIFKHPFLDKNDVSDRMYITSAEIISDNLSAVSDLLMAVNQKIKLKNFPMHIELRKNADKFIPIEFNPLRFCGWCITDIAYFAYGINPYEFFMENKKPDWQTILKENNSIYAFIMCELPNIDKNLIEKFDIEKFKKYTNAEILETKEFDFHKKPMFAVLFVKANSYETIKHILKADMKDFTVLKRQAEV